MTTTEPRFTAAQLHTVVQQADHFGTNVTVDPASILALLAEIERLTDTEKVQGVMIRELQRLNTELNNELGTAVQVLRLERDSLRAEVDRITCVARDLAVSQLERHHQRDAALAEVERLINLVERNGIRYCLCSRADRMNERVRPECPHHGNMTAWKRASIAIAENTSLRARLAAGLQAINDMDAKSVDEGLLEPDTESADAAMIRAALAEGKTK